jgi:hypothetical protein
MQAAAQRSETAPVVSSTDDIGLSADLKNPKFSEAFAL